MSVVAKSKVPVSVMIGFLVVIVATMGGAMTEKIINIKGVIAVVAVVQAAVLVLLVRGPAILMVGAVQGAVLVLLVRGPAIFMVQAVQGAVLVLLVRRPAILMVEAVMGVVLLIAIVEVE